MNIHYLENQQFHLFNQEIRYILRYRKMVNYCILYYGENLRDNDYSHLIEMHHRPIDNL